MAEALPKTPVKSLAPGVTGWLQGRRFFTPPTPARRLSNCSARRARPCSLKSKSWGDSLETSDDSIFLNAPAGKFLGSTHRNQRPYACVAPVPTRRLFGAPVAQLLLGWCHVRHLDRKETSGGRAGSPQPFHLHAVGILALQSERLDRLARTRAVLDADRQPLAGRACGGCS